MKKLYLLTFMVSLSFINNNIFSQADILTILHVNDTHSCLTSLSPRDETLNGTRGGIARAATLIGMTKLTEQNVLTLHAGDAFIGDIFFNVFFGAEEFQLMNSIGFNAMTLGNHEFDLQPSTLEAALQNSFSPEEGFSILSANSVFPLDTLQALKAYIKPFAIKQIGNLKVGIFGLTTPETNILSFPSPVFIDTNIVQIAADMIDSLKSKNCNVIICLSHLGLELDKILANYIPYIDVIVGGHDHYALDEPITIQQSDTKTTYIVQADAFYSHIGKMKLLVSGENVSLLDYQLIPLDENISEEETVEEVVSNLASQVESTYGDVFNQQIGYAESDFEEVADPVKNGFSDTPIGNLVTDAFREKTGTDVAIEPCGSTAQPIYVGPIVAADVFRTVGYGFNTINGLGYRLVTFNMTGMDIISGLEFGISNVEQNDEFLIQVSGMNYGFDLTQTPYQRVTYVLINGNPVNLDSSYSITANEFVLGFLQQFLGINVTNISYVDDLTEFQVLTEYISSKGTISPQSESRITEVKELIKSETLPNEIKLNQNFPNPFNPATNISFTISKENFTELKVYNLIGEEISTLVATDLEPGFYNISWNASNLSSGIYFYRLQAGDFVATKKMLLLK